MYGGRIYYVSWDAATGITASIDIFEFAPADDKPLFLHELHVWQTSDAKDAEEELRGLSLRWKYTTSGSGGATAAVRKKFDGDAAASFTAECRNTTLATGGTPDIQPLDGWNIRVPYIWTPAPEDRPFVAQPQTQLVVRLDDAPADSLTMNAMAIVEELG